MNSCELVKNHTYFTKWQIRTNVYELARTNSCDLLKITRILRSGKFVQMYTNSFVRIHAICEKSHVFYEVANS